MSIVIGVTGINAKGEIDPGLNSEDRMPGEGTLYFTSFSFYGLDELVMQGLEAALPSHYQTKKGKYWVVRYYVSSTYSGLFWGGDEKKSLLVCRSRKEALRLATALKTETHAVGASIHCEGVKSLGRYLLNHFTFHIQIIEGQRQPRKYLPIMRIDT